MKAQKSLPFLLLVASLLLQNCGSGKSQDSDDIPSTVTNSFIPSSTLSPIPTPAPTFTPSATPIPGIDVALKVNGTGIQVQSAVVGADPLNSFRLHSGYDTTLLVQVFLADYSAGIEFLAKNMETILVVDKDGRESKVEAMMSIETDTPWLVFEVAKDVNVFSLHFPDGQIIDLAPVIEVDPVSNVDGIISLDGVPLENIKIDLMVEEEVISSTQTDANGYYLFPNVLPNSYSLAFELEGDAVKCRISGSVGVNKGWQAKHDVSLESSLFSSGEFSITETLDLAICKPK